MDKEDLIGGSTQGSFMSYMFSMTDGEKVELINMFQYIILAIIPIIVIVRLMKSYIPPVSNTKGSAEVAIELIVQLVILVSVFFLIHKLILFIPTYTKQNYPSIQFFPILLPLLFILFTLDKNMGEKAQLLLQRGLVLLGINKENFAELEEEEKNQGQVSQNVSSQVVGQQMMPPQMSNPVMMEAPVRKSDKQQPQQYQQQYGIQEPSAANDFCGGYSSF